ncbi:MULTISPECIES: alpha/beta hydrolase [unclassified Streptomyces]|uniref:alpha/beta hydrolase n=1 Tax=unclassified Streptomyces TaxID=2593676 RepID=UPI003815BCE7
MSLTGALFFVLLIVITVLCVIGTMVLWSRLRGPRPLRWLLRFLMIALCQLTAISVVATWINDDYGLYASWDDLLGVDNGTVSMFGPPVNRAAFTRGDAGTLDTYFRGRHSHMAGQVIVWTPPQYKEAKHRHTRFPVVLLLHGVPGSPASWLEHGGMPGDFRRLMEAGTSHPFILAMPVIDPGGVNTDCTDQRQGKVATWVARDVPELLSHRFRTLSGPQGWALMGFSTGGFCAARLPLAYPKVFGPAAALDPDPLTGDPGVITNAADRERTSPTYLVKHTKVATHLFLATSAEDPDSPPRSLRQFERAAAGTGVTTQVTVVPTGGHNYNTWTRFYPAAFSFLSRHTTAPTG